jgi:hypothetical protein
MRFDEQVYLAEMTALVVAAKERMKSEHPDIEVYTINIWTDPDAARSAINFDTFENSVAQVAQQNAWNKKHYDRLVAEGEYDEAQLFLPSAERFGNPANFAFTEIETIQNQSFDRAWEKESAGKCWDFLEPALLKIGGMARDMFSSLKLHPQAELSVNSRRDWYDHAWLMRQ